MKIIATFFALVVSCISFQGCSGHKNWMPAAGWETLNAEHRIETIEHCKQDADFERCMYANSYVYSKHGAVMPLAPNESSQEEISVTEFKP